MGEAQYSSMKPWTDEEYFAYVRKMEQERGQRRTQCLERGWHWDEKTSQCTGAGVAGDAGMNDWQGGHGVDEVQRRPVRLHVDTRAVDWARSEEVYQVKRDGVWHDETREQFLSRPFGEQWRVRLVPGLVEQRDDAAQEDHADERDGRDEEPELQAEGERAAPGPARAPVHDAPQQQTKDAGNEQQHGHASR